MIYQPVESINKLNNQAALELLKSICWRERPLSRDSKVKSTGCFRVIIRPMSDDRFAPVYERLLRDFSDTNKNQRPGSAIVAFNQEDSLIDYQGLANIEQGLSIGANTRFQVASLALVFTALAVLLLEREGSLNIEQPLSEHLPDFALSQFPIKIKHLLTHTSGIRDQWPLMEWAGWREGDPVDTNDILGVLYRQDDLQFEPGSDFVYCNSGFTLLGLIVERLSGVPFESFLKEEVLKPLGMKNSLVTTDSRQIIKDQASAYQVTSDGRIIDFTPRIHVAGSSSLLTTAQDMLAWISYGWRTEPFTDLFKVLSSPQSLNSGQKIGYGLGVFLGSFAGQRAVIHTGLNMGFSSIFVIQPKQVRGAAIMSNHPVRGTLASTEMVLRSLAEISAPGALTMTDSGLKKLPTGKPSPDASKVSFVGADLTGIYRFPQIGSEIRITQLDQDTIEVELAKGVKKRLALVAPGAFADGSIQITSNDPSCFELMISGRRCFDVLIKRLQG